MANLLGLRFQQAVQLRHLPQRARAVRGPLLRQPRAQRKELQRDLPRLETYADLLNIFVSIDGILF